MSDPNSPGSARLDLPLDRSRPQPLHCQLAQQLKRSIEHGHLAPGSLLSNEIKMAEEFGLSRVTVRRAIQSLADEGLLVRRRGIGTQVAYCPVSRSLSLTSLHDDLGTAGPSPDSEVLRNATEPASAEVAAALAIPESSEVTVLERLQAAHGVPIAYLRHYLPAGLLVLTSGRLESTGLYGLMTAAAIAVHSTQQAIGARKATAGESALLGVTEGTALLTVRRTMFDRTGRAVEYADHCYVSARREFAFQLFSRPDGEAARRPGARHRPPREISL